MSKGREKIAQDNRATILNYLISNGDDAKTLREIEAATGLEYSTVHRHIDTLMTLGAVNMVPLLRARNGTKMAFKANNTDSLTLVNTDGRLQKATDVLFFIFNLGENILAGINSESHMSSRRIFLRNSPMVYAALAIGDVLRQANGQDVAGFSRIQKSVLQDAIGMLEQQVIVLKSILASESLWDRKILGENDTFAISPESFKRIADLANGIAAIESKKA